ncbi:uncharacterized skeletal organic matrix protein 5-like [Stylophora pistillata]|uniref:uncharacterized skeletal organic matrix protein 5-like n=1 Tax=Stylophora pistillata TaxID=50429 RepID=UPI000C053CA6|nr:uncharacterized skeletal organic matrix protein 5-like [Stylophora pistillata]
MTTLGACGGGGWTMVMKVDGSKDTFQYHSNLWGNMVEFDASAGMTGFDEQETKLPTYWNTSFKSICLGMKNGDETNFVLINEPADSLYSLIADGQYRSTSLGRDSWKSLIGSEASLQNYCYAEGFNVHPNSTNSKARIGLIANNEQSCGTCDSRIGFGCTGAGSYTCGNRAANGADNGDKNIKVMGYIFVQ